MVDYLIDWARNTQIIRKINLEVRISNKWAIHLYESLGFKIEGVITRGFFLNEVFHDLYMMGLEID
jgi:RimJ/RimL family protein N-acetyltransferase